MHEGEARLCLICINYKFNMISNFLYSDTLQRASSKPAVGRLRYSTLTYFLPVIQVLPTVQVLLTAQLPLVIRLPPITQLLILLAIRVLPTILLLPTAQRLPAPQLLPTLYLLLAITVSRLLLLFPFDCACRGSACEGGRPVRGRWRGGLEVAARCWR
jgi:hypothetical protein